MHRCELLVKNITPLVIAGADQYHIKNEGIRPPTLKGLMRWWFRAVMGGYVSSMKHLRELEGDVFGNTEQKSAVNVMSEPISNSLSRSKASELDLGRGVRYLWFSITFGKREERSLYEEGSTFRISLSSFKEQPFKIAQDSLWLLLYLGGVGTRSRRGLGNLKVQEENVPFPFKIQASRVRDFSNALEDRLREIFDDFKEFAKKKGKLDTSFSPRKWNFCVLSQETAELSLINKVYTNYREGLEEIGQTYQNYRRSIRNVGYRTVFGLPIIRRRARNFLGRKSSPLMIGVSPLKEGYAIRLVKFFTSYHGEDTSKKWVKRHLTRFDDRIKKEIKIELP